MAEKNLNNRWSDDEYFTKGLIDARDDLIFQGEAELIKGNLLDARACFGTSHAVSIYLEDAGCLGLCASLLRKTGIDEEEFRQYAKDAMECLFDTLKGMPK
ncbi:hypothetical protein J4225_04315 [Candidatus Pacearchaeota archaeon]|nr:hypothetical protein [Candidatus Pacearchaeota archaeon]